MTKKTQSIGILGGTFDPIHFGHLRCALEVYQCLHLAELKFLPCSQHSLKPQATASAEQRLDMLTLAVQEQADFTIDTRELNTKGNAYSVVSLQAIRQEISNDTPVCFILGTDAFNQFDQWHEWRELLRLAHLVVVQRPEYPLDLNHTLKDFLQQHQTKDRQWLHQQPHGLIYLSSITKLPISSTTIREQIRLGLNPSYLIPQSVYQYIQTHGIYRQS